MAIGRAFARAKAYSNRQALRSSARMTRRDSVDSDGVRLAKRDSVDGLWDTVSLQSKDASKLVGGVVREMDYVTVWRHKDANRNCWRLHVPMDFGRKRYRRIMALVAEIIGYNLLADKHDLGFRQFWLPGLSDQQRTSIGYICDDTSHGGRRAELIFVPSR